MSEKQYTIGRNADNQIKLVQPQVSGNHAILTVISDNVMVLEDNNSTNGTFVNGVRVKRMLITQKDEVLLGNVRVKFDKVFAANRPASPLTPAKPTHTDDYGTEFTHLKEVYETYRKTKLALQSGKLSTGVAIRASLSLIPFVGNALGILASSAVSDREKEYALNEEFQINYVCPKCKRFLGFLPWQNLANQKRCASCKAVWVQDSKD